MCVGTLQPVHTGFIFKQITRIFVQQYQRMGMCIDSRWRCLHRLFKISHDHIDAGRQCFGLARSQVIRQLINIGVEYRL